MNPRFIDLYRWDVRHVGRSTLLWTVLMMLSVSFVVGALNTAYRHGEQTHAQQRLAAAESAHDRSLAERTRAYAAPISAAAPSIPYWQDPTNVSGFSQYQVVRHATKPHLPSSPLAVGVSDLAPGWISVKVNSVSGSDQPYDFQNPRGLALGWFGLGFALTVLMPLTLILILGLLVTFERDHGMLRLVAAQSVSPRIWLAARVAAVLSWAIPVVLAALAMALLLSGVSFSIAWPELLAALMLTGCYMLLWAGIATACLSRLPTAAGAISSLTAVWIVLVFGLPILATTVGAALLPAPATSANVDALRRTTDAVERDRDDIIRRAFAARPDLRGSEERIAKLDYATRLTFTVPEIERRMAPLRTEASNAAARQERLAEVAGYIIPPLGFAGSLSILAGTDVVRYRAFEAAARAYQLRLRAFFYPLVQREIASPTPRSGPLRRGRFNFVTAGDMPAFAIEVPAASGRIVSVLPMALWLAAIGTAFFFIGLMGARRWPEEVR